MAEQTLADRFKTLDGRRQYKLNIARKCASLTIPSVLPPNGWAADTNLPQPYSSVASRGVTAMASKMLSALMPLNDSPFFKLGLKNGAEPSNEIKSYLETLSFQIYNKVISQNLRDNLFQALQHLIIVGDVMVIIEDDFSFRNIRIDQYVIQRNVYGKVIEIIYLEYIPIDPEDIDIDLQSSTNLELRNGYKTLYCQYILDEDEKIWYSRKEDVDGNLFSKGEVSILPLIPLRWYGIVGENYGRSHCEDILGDIISLENYTQAHIEGMAASSTFWIGVDPSGLTEIDDIATASNGSFVPAKQQDVFCISPSTTLNPQVGSTQAAVREIRSEVSEAFLMARGSMPTGDRVTATAIRMVGSELETVLGGAFSAIARDLMEPIIKRTIFLMLSNGDLDEGLNEQFFEKDGTLNVEIVTGLQALSRDTDLQKLMQLGEMVRNLPPEALQTFRWDAYSKALISSLGFDPRMWVKSEEEIAQQQQAMQAQQMQMQAQQKTGDALTNGVINTAANAAQTDIAENGGENVMAMAQQMGIDPQQIMSKLGLQQ